MFDTVVPAAFKNIDKTDNVRIHICMGVLKRIPHPCLCGKVNNNIKVVFLKYMFKTCQVFPNLTGL